MQLGYVKSNITKHNTPNIFYPHQFQQSGEISILQISVAIFLQIYSLSLHHISHFQNMLMI
jgi:hypothetical protein